MPIEQPRDRLMCVVSNIGGYYEKRYPQWPSPIPWPPREKTDKEEIEERARKMREFLDLVKRAEKTDKVMGEPDCERAEVKKFIKDVSDRLAAIEKRLAEFERKKKPKKRARKAK